ncbi:3D-(3,5/4)-trihydroxycyclohexane-1,2-dione acylhydrolase (decyclizing) [Cohnella sp. CIP 111063]|uniref:3D-(3,5/4)-trihydroxycyclohexane-1,2-dione acylhydrolase (decyclizing) n=1 Tax=unclassified Cohnella TaxID=2636738 RepID=UPI000B8BB42D|nr:MULTISPECIES: 3D-(3,5/4)-trihydroxycyclohexane-1,2-dione acylhydrolase (decyclizing) [unclassified Cohnella]OXS54673.1 3D-(3,5/4)-trihydroxycyclohexane-1,2-dione acylhydrolase (decyclizing) [Cohnella sp. CIP 111063]PRX64504.1 3D-(3,5/4)-trihydroxycyclohexane-1,2-dione hydrolase [Cohnella sp. SGD-V74]
MNKIRLTMAQALLKFLDRQYVSVDGEETKFVAGVMGIFGHGNVTGIGEALERGAAGSLAFIQGKNEQGMVHAATAYAKQKNRRQIFACTSSIGPGALNMVTGAATATVNRIPVLLLPGDNFASRQPDPVLQQLEVPGDYTVSANDSFKAVSRFWDRIVRPEQLMQSLLHAMRVLTDPADTGAVTLALPQDVQAEAYDYPESFFAKRVHCLERRPPAPDALQRAVELVASKRRPLLVAGGGVHYADATKELLAFAEDFGIPVAETQAGKSAMAWNHPLSLGGVGTTGTLAANRFAAEADLIIGVGTRFTDFTTASKSAFRNPEAAFLSLNVSSFDTAKLDAAAVTADAKLTLVALRERLSERGYRSGYEAESIRESKAEWDREVDRLYGLESPEGLTQTRALGIVNEFAGPRAVAVGAAGSLPGDLHRLWRCSEPKTYHLEYGFSCMGYEISGAFGAALAEPERDVYAIVGDGSFLMLHSELVTAIQEGVKLTVLLFDNSGFQCIHNLQREHGSDGFGNEFRFRSKESGKLDGARLPIDFATIARGLGAAAYTARDAEQLKRALNDAKAERGPALIEIKVLAGTNTGGYESWWHVGVPAASASGKVLEAHGRMRQRVEAARPY